MGRRRGEWRPDVRGGTKEAAGSGGLMQGGSTAEEGGATAKEIRRGEALTRGRAEPPWSGAGGEEDGDA
jgi:hypothetical protein